MKELFSGVATALVTPFTKKLKVDYPALENLIERQIKQRVSALVILGTTGEIATLTEAERKIIIDFSLTVTRGRVPLIFGIGGNDPQRIIKLGHYVQQVTAKYPQQKFALMVTAPYYNKATQAGAVMFFQTIIDRLQLPTIIYNVPGRTGFNLTPETLAKIAELPQVVGIKEASGDLNQITETVRLCPNVAVYCGDDTLALPCYAVGCRGIISVAANLAANSVQKVWELYQNNHPAEALRFFQDELPTYRSLFTVVNPIPVKSALYHLGLIENALRLPLTPLP